MKAGTNLKEQPAKAGRFAITCRSNSSSSDRRGSVIYLIVPFSQTGVQALNLVMIWSWTLNLQW